MKNENSELLDRWIVAFLEPPAVVDPFAPQLLSLQLTVLWGEGGPRERLQLHSLRLVQADAIAGALP